MAINGEKSKLKNVLGDSVLSIAGLILMNVVLQFIVYPSWRSEYNAEIYGDILYLISLMNIIAVSMGVACNYARMTEVQTGKNKNLPYIAILGLSSLYGIIAAILFGAFGGVEMSVLEIILYAILLCLTMWRYYADVEFRMSLNYKGFFLYYFLISIGYGVGIFLFKLTGLWAMALIPGELFGILLVVIFGHVFEPDTLSDKKYFNAVLRTVLLLFGAEILSTIVFNGDRVVLKHFVGSSAVTIYYLASLLGKTIALLTTPLNGVIVGYLSRYKGRLTLKIMNIVLALSLGAVIIATFACTIGSHIIISRLYPEDYESAKTYFIIANLAQVLYFAAGVVTVVLLKFSKSRYQIYVNVAFAVAFVAVCIPMSYFGGLLGFCWGMIISCGVRYISGILLGYKDALIQTSVSHRSEKIVSESNRGGKNDY